MERVIVLLRAVLLLGIFSGHPSLSVHNLGMLFAEDYMRVAVKGAPAFAVKVREPLLVKRWIY